MALIELKDVARSYWVGDEKLIVLKGISLKIEEGEFTAIMGPSGSGKSTLMQILGLLDRPSCGAYHLMGRDVSRLSDDEGAVLRSKTIGFIFQMFNLLARTSAMDNVALPMIYSGAPNRQLRARELLQDVGLGDRLTHKPNQLSGGQQQRVAVARALVNRPKILFADEPTGNLASDQAEEILRQLELLNRSGITVIMVTHEPDIAAHAARIIRLRDGSVVADETTGKGGHCGGAAVATATAARKTAQTTSLKLRTPDFSWAEFSEYGASALRAMAANKMRSALSMLGILIGVAAVIAMLAVGRGAQKSVETRLSSLGSNLITLMPGRPSSHGIRGSSGSYSRLTIDDAKAIQQSSPHVVNVDGNASWNTQVVYKNQNINTQITGAGAVYAEMRASQPYYGRFFTETENQRMERVALLGQTVVNNLFDQEDPVGKFIKINRINFKVIGILPIKGSSTWRDQDDLIIVPLNTAMKRLMGKQYLNSIAIECDSPEAMPAVMSSI